MKRKIKKFLICFLLTNILLTSFPLEAQASVLDTLKETVKEIIGFLNEKMEYLELPRPFYCYCEGRWMKDGNDWKCCEKGEIIWKNDQPQCKGALKTKDELSKEACGGFLPKKLHFIYCEGEPGSGCDAFNGLLPWLVGIMTFPQGPRGGFFDMKTLLFPLDLRTIWEEKETTIKRRKREQKWASLKRGREEDICALKIPPYYPPIERSLSAEILARQRIGCSYFREIKRSAEKLVYFSKQIYKNTDPYEECSILNNCRTYCKYGFGTFGYSISVLELISMITPLGWASYITKVMKFISKVLMIVDEAQKIAEKALSLKDDLVALWERIKEGLKGFKLFAKAVRSMAKRGLRQKLRMFVEGLIELEEAKAEVLANVNEGKNLLENMKLATKEKIWFLFPPENMICRDEACKNSAGFAWDSQKCKENSGCRCERACRTWSKLLKIIKNFTKDIFASFKFDYKAQELLDQFPQIGNKRIWHFYKLAKEKDKFYLLRPDSWYQDILDFLAPMPNDVNPYHPPLTLWHAINRVQCLTRGESCGTVKGYCGAAICEKIKTADSPEDKIKKIYVLKSALLGIVEGVPKMREKIGNIESLTPEMISKPYFTTTSIDALPKDFPSDDPVSLKKAFPPLEVVEKFKKEIEDKDKIKKIIGIAQSVDFEYLLEKAKEGLGVIDGLEEKMKNYSCQIPDDFIGDPKNKICQANIERVKEECKKECSLECLWVRAICYFVPPTIDRLINSHIDKIQNILSVQERENGQEMINKLREVYLLTIKTILENYKTKIGKVSFALHDQIYNDILPEIDEKTEALIGELDGLKKIWNVVKLNYGLRDIWQKAIYMQEKALRMKENLDILLTKFNELWNAMEKLKEKRKLISPSLDEVQPLKTKEGVFGPGTYIYKITAYDANGNQTLPSDQGTCVIEKDSGNNACKIIWLAPGEAKGYKIYRQPAPTCSLSPWYVFSLPRDAIREDKEGRFVWEDPGLAGECAGLPQANETSIIKSILSEEDEKKILDAISKSKLKIENSKNPARLDLKEIVGQKPSKNINCSDYLEKEDPSEHYFLDNIDCYQKTFLEGKSFQDIIDYFTLLEILERGDDLVENIWKKTSQFRLTTEYDFYDKIVEIIEDIQNSIIALGGNILTECKRVSEQDQTAGIGELGILGQISGIVNCLRDKPEITKNREKKLVSNYYKEDFYDGIIKNKIEPRVFFKECDQELRGIWGVAKEASCEIECQKVNGKLRCNVNCPDYRSACATTRCYQDCEAEANEKHFLTGENKDNFMEACTLSCKQGIFNQLLEIWSILLAIKGGWKGVSTFFSGSIEIDGKNRSLEVKVGVDKEIGEEVGHLLAEAEELVDMIKKFNEMVKNFDLIATTSTAKTEKGVDLSKIIRCRAMPAYGYGGKTGPGGGLVCPDVRGYFDMLASEFQKIRQLTIQLDLLRRETKEYRIKGWCRTFGVKGEDDCFNFEKYDEKEIINEKGEEEIVKYCCLDLKFINTFPLLDDNPNFPLNLLYDKADKIRKEARDLWAWALAENFSVAHCTCGKSFCHKYFCLSGMPLTPNAFTNPYCLLVYLIREFMKGSIDNLEEVVKIK